eukprot:jgi/Mesvir1/697/Mv17309-RA.1
MDCVIDGVARPHASRDKRIQLLVTGTNLKGETNFRLPHPIRGVKSCRLMWASTPATSPFSTAVYVKLGGVEINKVHAAIPQAASSLEPAQVYAGRGHFFIVPNGTETYVPMNERDDTVLFSPDLASASDIDVELYALPSPTRELLDLNGELFAMMFEIVAAHR